MIQIISDDPFELRSEIERLLLAEKTATFRASEDCYLCTEKTRFEISD